MSGAVGLKNSTVISKKSRRPKKAQRSMVGWGSLASTVKTAGVYPAPPSPRERVDGVLKENRAIQLKLLQKEAELLLMDPLKLESLESELEERNLTAMLTELGSRTAAVEERGAQAAIRHGHNCERARRMIQGDTVRYQRAVIRDRELKADAERHRRELGVVRSEWFSERDVQAMKCADLERKIQEKKTASERSKARLKKQGGLKATYGDQIEALRRENKALQEVITEAHEHVETKLGSVYEILESHRESHGGASLGHAPTLGHGALSSTRSMSSDSSREADGPPPHTRPVAFVQGFVHKFCMQLNGLLATSRAASMLVEEEELHSTQAERSRKLDEATVQHGAVKAARDAAVSEADDAQSAVDAAESAKRAEVDKVAAAERAADDEVAALAAKRADLADADDRLKEALAGIAKAKADLEPLSTRIAALTAEIRAVDGDAPRTAEAPPRDDAKRAPSPDDDETTDRVRAEFAKFEEETVAEDAAEIDAALSKVDAFLAKLKA